MSFSIISDPPNILSVRKRFQKLRWFADTATTNNYASSFTSLSGGFLMFQEWGKHCHPYRSAIFHLLPGPNAHPQNPLKLLGRIKPATTVAKSMCRQIVVECVCSASGMSEDVVSGKSCFVDLTTAEMTAPVGFAEHNTALLEG
jgi:hypothetical protein